jgi:hypothetical protein
LAVAALALLLPAAALAQQSTAPANGSASASNQAGAANPKVVKSGRLEETHGGWRSSRLVGADVYDDHDQAIGSIDDLIVGKDGKIDTAVLSVGGLLGIGGKLVSVPYDQLKFQEHNDTEGTGATPAATPGLGAPATPPSPAVGAASGTATGTASGMTSPGAGTAPAGSMAANSSGATPPTTPPVAQPVTYKTTRIVLPGASADSLKSMPEFTYQP